MPTSKDFTNTCALLNLFRNVVNYHNNVKIQQASATAVHVCCKWIKPTIGWGWVEHWTHKHTWLLDSLFCITCSLEKQWILCSALCHKSYLTLTYVTSLRDSLCLGTFAHGFIRLLPCSCSMVISNQKLVPPLSRYSLVKFYSLIFIFNYGTLKGLTDQSIMIINFMILVTSVPKDVFKC